VLNPLDHLLAGNDEAVPLPEPLLQPVKGQMIVKTGQNNADGQTQSPPALGIKRGGKGAIATPVSPQR